jgi:hypothetical protein
MKRFWALVLCALLAGCGNNCPEDMAGNSASCGNPVKIAGLETVTQNDCNSMEGACGGALPRTPVHIGFGRTLSIRPQVRGETRIDSVRAKLYLYRADQAPDFSPEPLGTFEMRDSAFLLTAGDLESAGLNVSQIDPKLWLFSARIRLTFYRDTVVIVQEKLMAGLAYDAGPGIFRASENNPLADPESTQVIGELIGFYRGVVETPDSLLAGARSAHVYIAGSPYTTLVDLSDKHFILKSLPVGDAFELRFFSVPVSRPAVGKVAVYRLESDSGAGPDRPFRIRDRGDSLSLP